MKTILFITQDIDLLKKRGYQELPGIEIRFLKPMEVLAGAAADVIIIDELDFRSETEADLYQGWLNTKLLCRLVPGGRLIDHGLSVT